MNVLSQSQEIVDGVQTFLKFRIVICTEGGTDHGEANFAECGRRHRCFADN